MQANHRPRQLPVARTPRLASPATATLAHRLKPLAFLFPVLDAVTAVVQPVAARGGAHGGRHRQAGGGDVWERTVTTCSLLSLCPPSILLAPASTAPPTS